MIPKNKPIRILHCPLNTGNIPWIMSRAERNLGLKSDLIVLKEHPLYIDNFDQNLEIDLPTIPNEIKRIKLLKWALNNYDIFYFNFGSTIIDHPFPGFFYLDLPILKRAKKKIIMLYQGDDVRDRKYFFQKYKSPYPTSQYSIKDSFWDYIHKKRAEKIARFADRIFAVSPDLMNFIPARAKLLPVPVDLSSLKPSKKYSKNKITIVHAPSDRSAKGSETIIKIVKRLMTKYPINFILVEKTRYTKALAIYQQADIVIDQILIGWYGSFAAETMAMGIPTIAYLRQTDLTQYVPFYQEIPIVNANEESLEVSLSVLIKNEKLRMEIGQKSRKYVEKYHDSAKIAQENKKMYEDLCAE